jgi:hypothetical protein
MRFKICFCPAILTIFRNVIIAQLWRFEDARFWDQKLVDHEEYFFLLSKAQENRIKINLRA